jgi:hypothetical protein
VQEGKSGFFFDAQTPESLVSAIQAFEKHTPLAVEAVRKAALPFSREQFVEGVVRLLEEPQAHILRTRLGA